MDRPCWKNEAFTFRLDRSSDKFTMNVFRSNRDQREQLDSTSSYSGLGAPKEKHEATSDTPSAAELFDKLMFPNPFKQKGLDPKKFTQKPEIRFKIKSQKHNDTTYFFNI